MAIEIEELVKVDNMLDILIAEGLTDNLSMDTFREISRKHIYNDDIHAYCGCTKAVFVDNDCDWVVKVPFSNSTYGKFNIKGKYCEIEYINYKKAEKQNLSYCFAEVTKYFKDGYCFYLQRKAVCDEDTNSDSFVDYAAECLDRNDFEDEDTYNDAVCDLAADLSDEQCVEAILGEGEELIKFLNVNEINDLHAGNFGYIDGNPVIIDYSGF